jgi:hypothetical protein
MIFFDDFCVTQNRAEPGLPLWQPAERNLPSIQVTFAKRSGAAGGRSRFIAETNRMHQILPLGCVRSAWKPVDEVACAD